MVVEWLHVALPDYPIKYYDVANKSNIIGVQFQNILQSPDLFKQLFSNYSTWAAFVPTIDNENWFACRFANIYPYAYTHIAHIYEHT